VSAGLPLRFLAGLLALNTNIFRFEVIVYTVLIYFYSIGNLASWMIVEIDEKKAKNEIQEHLQDRKQAKLFVGEQGPRLQRWGLTAALVCGFLLVLYILVGASKDNAAKGMDNLLTYTSWLFHVSSLPGYLFALALVAVIAGVTGYFFQFPLGRLLERLIPIASSAPLRRKTTDKMNLTGNKERIMGPLIILLGVAVIILVWNRDLAAIMIALLLPIISLLLYEAITYQEYSFANLIRNLPLLKVMWTGFLFDATAGIRFSEVLMATVNANIDLGALRAAIVARYPVLSSKL
jgi:hypothetical protein